MVKSVLVSKEIGLVEGEFLHYERDIPSFRPSSEFKHLSCPLSRFGLVQDALVMTLGLVMLTAMWGLNLNGWIICYAWSAFIYGFGVGGEYPMTSTTSMEYKAGSQSRAGNQRDDKLHRGRNVVLAFLMQGWGQLFNVSYLWEICRD